MSRTFMEIMTDLDNIKEELDEKIFNEVVAKPKASEWIPVTERLPEERKVVLITNDKGNVRYGQFRGTSGKYWHWKGNTNEEVIAWQPLPEPYEEEE